MPELPEVEVARRVIASVLEGGRVERVWVRDALVAKGLAGLEGWRAERVARRGKWLRIELTSGTEKGAGERRDDAQGAVILFAHLGMSGKWLAIEPGAPELPYERVRVEVVRGGKRGGLVYLDTRRLGRIRAAHADTATWAALGPDVLEDGVDAHALFRALQGTRRSVKEALLDQRILAGAGNIHAIEALWRARIDPRSRSDALSLADVRALARAVRASIAFGLGLYGREAALAYVNEAEGANPYRIYQRHGTPCPRCRTPLAKIVLGGRGTTFCPSCQRRIVGAPR